MPAGSSCNPLADVHVGPIETGLGTGHREEFLVERCLACGYEWTLSWLPPERREQLLRARSRGQG
jgi:hypothetical protein